MFKKHENVTLNIGLMTRYGPAHVVSLLWWLRANMSGAESVFLPAIAGAEPTAVVKGTLVRYLWEPDNLNAKIGALARLLDQDSIAVYLHRTGEGMLIGHDNTRRQGWGRFNSAYFYHLDEAKELEAMTNQPLHETVRAEVPKNDMRQRMEGRELSRGFASVAERCAKALAVNTTTPPKSDAVRLDSPAAAYKPTHGGYPG